MPYTGPSKGCTTCLARKVKCDERKPTCTRCERAKKICGGYRDTGDVIFRDDTESARRRTHKKPVYDGVVLEVLDVEKRAGSKSNLREGFVNASSQTLIVGPLFEPIGRRAVSTFFHDYAWTRKKYTFSLDFLPREYNWAKSGSSLIATTEAVALAHLGHVTGDINVQSLAIKQYGAALSLTNTALSGDSEALLDETMMSVHLLILFENITTHAAGTAKSLLPWITHVGGATLLLMKRGPAQLDRDVGVAMFQIQVVKMIVYGFINGESTPSLFDDWSEAADYSLRDPSFKIMKLMSSGAGLLERAKDILVSKTGSGSSPKLPLAHQHSDLDIQELTELIEDLVELDHKLDQSGKILLGTKDNLCNCHSTWLTSNWSFFLASRLVLNRVLEDCAMHLSQWTSISFHTLRSNANSDNRLGNIYNTGDSVLKAHDLNLPRLIRKSLATQSILVNLICDCIPQAIGLSDGFPSLPFSPDRSPLQSYFMMWPLHVTLHAPKNIESVRREWIRSILEYIADKEGLQLAKILVDEPYHLLDQLEYVEPKRSLAFRASPRG